MEKIDKRLTNLITSFADVKKIDCFVYYRNKAEILRIFKNIHIENDYFFIRALHCKMTKEEILTYSKLNAVEYISSLSKATCQMNVSKEILKAEEVALMGKGVNVAVIDTGIFPHADFLLGENRIKFFKDFVAEKKEPYDDNGQGTFVAVCARVEGIFHNSNIVELLQRRNFLCLKHWMKMERRRLIRFWMLWSGCLTTILPKILGLFV